MTTESSCPSPFLPNRSISLDLKQFGYASDLRNCAFHDVPQEF
jgi:hypothetical protein